MPALRASPRETQPSHHLRYVTLTVALVSSSVAGSSTASAGECDQLFVQLLRNLDAFCDGLLRQRLPTFAGQAHSGLGGHRRNQRFDPLVVHRASGKRARIDDQKRLADPWPAAFGEKEAL